MMISIRDTVSGEFLSRNSLDAAEMCAQTDGRYVMADIPAEPPSPGAVAVLSQAELPAPIPKPEGDELIDAISSVIGELDPIEDYNTHGAPSLRALSDLLGYDVTEEERDTAWDDYKMAQKVAAANAAKTK